MWPVVTIVSIVLATLYCLLIILYTYYFNRLTPLPYNDKIHPVTRFSIVIPARNEEENVGNTLASILKNNYPKELYEIIVVDDFSTDNTAIVIHEIQKEFTNVQLISLKDHVRDQLNSYKKKAIKVAISLAKKN